MKATYTIYGVVFTPAEKMGEGRPALVSPFRHVITAESAVAADRALHELFRQYPGGAYDPAEVLIAATLLPDAPMVPDAPSDAVTLFGVRRMTATSPWTRLVLHRQDNELDRVYSGPVGKLSTPGAITAEEAAGLIDFRVVKLPGWFVATRALSGSAHRGAPASAYPCIAIGRCVS